MASSSSGGGVLSPGSGIAAGEVKVTLLLSFQLDSSVHGERMRKDTNPS